LLGFTPKQFEIEDVLLWGKLMSLDLSLNMGFEALRYSLLIEQGISPERIQELLPPYPADALTILSNEDIAHFNLYL
jgi:acyl-homoserine lactone acylase PvdQ